MKKSIALGSLIVALAVTASANATIEVDGATIEVVDMHLHPGHFGQMPAEAVGYLGAGAPGPARLFLPVIFEKLLDPYSTHIGIQEQTKMAGVDHAVLLAVYTHHTTGYFTNEQLISTLMDSRNVVGEDTPGPRNWAWGMVSINFFDGYLDPGVAESRLQAVESHLEAHRDLIIGIKLAHAHQHVAFDDTRYLGIYDVAAKYAVPVLLHTGFSPFPSSQTDPAYYDPSGLESVISHYDGAHGVPRVNFVLAHAGQGDARSVEHALQLAARYDNVYIDLSALKRPTLIDESGNESTETGHQYPYVVAEVKGRGLIPHALWSTDGAQFSGMIHDYLNLLVDEMKAAGYSVDELRAVLSGNFYGLYFAGATPSY